MYVLILYKSLLFDVLFSSVLGRKTQRAAQNKSGLAQVCQTSDYTYMFMKESFCSLKQFSIM